MKAGLFVFTLFLMFVLYVFAFGASIEIETDPTAFVLSGYSLHAAYAWDNKRFSMGLFGLEVPEQVHGNSGWTERYDGFGVKYDHFFACETAGFFIGPEVNYLSALYRLDSAGGEARRDQLTVGGRIGYRYNFSETSGLYIVPWLGIDYVFRGDAVTLGGQTFDRSDIVLFPAIHIGWTFWDAIPVVSYR